MESILRVAVVMGMVVFLESLWVMHVNEEDKIFEIIEPRKPRGKVDDPFVLKSLFSCINLAYKFLA